jgi:hypothetical protein
LACRNEKCVDPCDCAANADCEARNHRGICTCRPGYTGDPYYEGCRPIPPPEPVNTECKVDVDCPALEICYTSGGSNRCVDPCSTIRPCVSNAECKVFSTTPTRTMTCTCFEGYTGNGVVRCDKITAPIEIGCSSDDECLSNQACRNRACINPCSFDDPCSSTAQCSVSNHKAECICPPGLTGDPYSLCVPSKIEIELIMMGHFFKRNYFCS